MNTLVLNEGQTKAYLTIKKFLADPDRHSLLLLGPAGAGKTTVIVNAFNGTPHRIAFCAFTNKATQVLSKISEKFAINFKADFLTIHKLLCLDIKFLERETEIGFTFDKNKIANLKEYNIIIFDECSTISRELYRYICEAYEYIEFAFGVKLKFIFLGDFWQLPPVGEEKSIVFDVAIKDRWLVSKLEKVMRSANETMANINQNMLEWIPKFKTGDVDKFVNGYPYNLVSKDLGDYLHLDEFLDQFLATWHTHTADCVILTYSRGNCDKTNQAIQDRIDDEAGREIPKKRDIIKFYPGDRCCIDRPIDLFSIVRKKCKTPPQVSAKRSQTSNSSSNLSSKSSSKSGETISELFARVMQSPEPGMEPGLPIGTVVEIVDDYGGVHVDTLGGLADAEMAPDGIITKQNTQPYISTVALHESLGITLYNGEIFDITDAEDVYAITPLNKLDYIDDAFPAQLLTISRISNPTDRYQILHIPEPYVEAARELIKSIERRMFYLNIMSDFIKKYPKLTYGYCLTIYKSQGSEWHTVFVNLNSIKWSIIGQTNASSIKKKAALYKSTYTALSRASSKLYCFWSR